MNVARTLLATVLLGSASLPAQDVTIEHFAQRGESLAAVATRVSDDTARVACGGIAKLLAAKASSPELVKKVAERFAALALAPDEVLAFARLRSRHGDALPFVACNVRDETDKPALRAYIVRQVGALRVAFIGVTGTGTRSVDLPVGWRIEDGYRPLYAALAAAAKESDRTVIVTTADVAECQALLAGTAAETVVLGLGSRGARSEPIPHLRGWICMSAQGGNALATLTFGWKDGKVADPRQSFRTAFLDEAEQATLAELVALRDRPAEKAPASRPATRKVEGLPGVGLDAEQVNRAIDRGSKALWQHVKAKDLWNETQVFGTDDKHWLVALALVHSKLHLKDREFESALRGALAIVEPRKLGTYVAGLLCMLVEDLGDPRYYPLLREAVRMLVESQGPSGSWGYGIKLPDELFDGDYAGSPLQVNNGLSLDDPLGITETWKRFTAPEFGGDGDNSSSQFALLGLRSAARLGIRVPNATWKNALAFYGRNQAPGGGWAYVSGDDKASYGSMTLAGLSALAICRHELALDDPTVDARIERAAGWIATRFKVDENPGEKNYLGYYLYSLERTGRILATEHFGEHEWYPRGCKQLLGMQRKDALWSIEPSEADERLATSFALLFLTRATATLKVEIPRGGKGRFRADIALPRRERIYFVLDASGSMLETLGTGTKFDAARTALAQVTRMIAPGSRVALRAYGHRLRAIEPGADDDSELVIKPSPLDHAAFEKRLFALRARGRTPLTLSLTEATKDLGALAAADTPTVVLLLSDGGEDTTTKRDPAAAAKKLAALPGVVLHVVGFDIGRDDWRAQLQAIAAAGRGGYFPAGRGDDLAKAIRDAFLPSPEGFVLRDAHGTEVARGKFGDEIELPEGQYEFVTEYQGKAWKRRVWINTGRLSSITYRG